MGSRISGQVMQCPTLVRAQFGADDRDYLDSFFAQMRIGISVAVIGDYHAWRDSDNIVAAVPLLTFRSVGVATSFNDAQRFQTERFRHHLNELFLFLSGGEIPRRTLDLQPSKAATC